MSLTLNTQRFYFRLCICSMPIWVFGVATYVRFLSGFWTPPSYDAHFYIFLLILTILIWSIAVDHYRITCVDELLREYTGVRKVFAACFMTYLCLVAVLFFYRQESLSRLFFALSIFMLFTLTLLTRMAFRRLFWKSLHSHRELRILIVGIDAYAVDIASKLSKVSVIPAKIVGYVRLPGQTQAIAESTILELDGIGVGMEVIFDEIVIAAPPVILHEIPDLRQRLGALGAPIRFAMDLGDAGTAMDKIYRIGNLQILSIAVTPIESAYYFALKRIFDMAFSTVALVFTGPLMLLIAILVKMSSPGPILFRQERIGLNGRSFTMYKFRTMRESTKGDTDARWTVANDVHRTRLGVFLRQTSLDELPQFFNVIKGDMSVVGPRPERPYFVKRFLQEVSYYNVRHRLKVGITGWAQVNGWRGDTSIEKRLECDLFYVQNWTFWFDIRILFLTVWAGLFGRNGY